MEMDPITESPKLPNMVMCGDHPSFTKTELNAKETDEKEQPIPLSFAKLSSTSARSLRTSPRRGRKSGHALDVTRRVSRDRLLDPQGHSGALVTAALGTFRWPPYLLTVWVIVLVLTHALHCLVSCLGRVLPRLRNLCEHLRSCTEHQWHSSATNRLCPAALAALTAALYALYCSLYVLHAVAVWSVEPLTDEKDGSVETKVTDYDESDV
ncbi:uncharacterized protein LOC134746507 [Cydia strobilella]|uniref:uncharacterized protein LOC134746507 n=1 Tax=Cydia strobilella TaxID=1100964 RepID=UPI003003A850